MEDFCQETVLASVTLVVERWLHCAPVRTGCWTGIGLCRSRNRLGSVDNDCCRCCPPIITVRNSSATAAPQTNSRGLVFSRRSAPTDLVERPLSKAAGTSQFVARTRSWGTCILKPRVQSVCPFSSSSAAVIYVAPLRTTQTMKQARYNCRGVTERLQHN